MLGKLSEARMWEIVDGQNTTLREEIKDLRNIIVSGLQLQSQQRKPTNQQSDPAFFHSGPHKLWLTDGILWRVPSDWEFPAGPVLSIYRYWHHGDEVRSISPLKLLIGLKWDLS
jgi:hypothetical protein